MGDSMKVHKDKTKEKIRDMTIMYRTMEKGLQETIKDKETKVSD